MLRKWNMELGLEAFVPENNYDVSSKFLWDAWGVVRWRGFIHLDKYLGRSVSFGWIQKPRRRQAKYDLVARSVGWITDCRNILDSTKWRMPLWNHFHTSDTSSWWSFFDITFVLKQCVLFTVHVFWYMTPCRLANSLGGTCCLQLHCSWRRVDYHENGGTKIIRNAGNNLSRISTNTAVLLQPCNLQSLLFLQNQGPIFTPLQSNYEMFGFCSSPNVATVLKSERRHGRIIYIYLFIYLCRAMGNKGVANNDAANVPVKAKRLFF